MCKSFTLWRAELAEPHALRNYPRQLQQQWRESYVGDEDVVPVLLHRWGFKFVFPRTASTRCLLGLDTLGFGHEEGDWLGSE